jgi:hypothetical protein
VTIRPRKAEESGEHGGGYGNECLDHGVLQPVDPATELADPFVEVVET